MANGCGVLCGVGDVFGGVAGSAETADAAAAHAILPAATPIGQRLRGRHRLGAGGPPIIGESIFGNLIRDGDAAPQVPDPSWTSPSADEPHAILPSIPVAPAGMARVDQPVPATMPWSTQGIFGGAVRRGDYGYTRLGGGVSGFGSAGSVAGAARHRALVADKAATAAKGTADEAAATQASLEASLKAAQLTTLAYQEQAMRAAQSAPMQSAPESAGSATIMWIGAGLLAAGAVAGAIYLKRKRSGK
jgi:hypothetical protein